MTPKALRERVPFFSDAKALTLTPLAGAISMNNHSYKVVADDWAYWVRVGAESARFLGVRRDEEQAALRSAAAVGLAPELCFASPDGLLVMPFVDGWHWTPKEAQRPENIARLAQTLRRLHALPCPAAPCSVYERIERMVASTRELGLTPPPELGPLLDWLYRLQAQRAADPRATPGLCHGDFWLHNFLDDGTQLWLIDWEFAGVGDGLVDLAKITIGGSEYTPEHQRQLLDAYGYTEPDDLAILHQMTQLLLLFQAVWALVQHGVCGSRRGFDFLMHSQATFAILKRSITESATAACL